MASKTTYKDSDRIFQNRLLMNYLDASNTRYQIPKKEKYDASILGIQPFKINHLAIRGVVLIFLKLSTMRPKKNPEKDLNRKSVLYFILGLLIILALIYIALEWKTEDDNRGFDIGTSAKKENPKKDSTVVLETDASEGDLPDKAINFALVEEPPIFPGCENTANKRTCFNRMMQKHIAKNFHYPETTKDLGLYSEISAHFVIGKDGSIDEIKIKAKAKNLETSLKQTIKKLPHFTPAKNSGEAVNIFYSIPINIHWKNQ